MNEEIGHGACLYMVAEFQHIAFCPRPHETSIFFSNYNGFRYFCVGRQAWCRNSCRFVSSLRTNGTRRLCYSAENISSYL